MLSGRTIALDAGTGAIGNAGGSITATGSATLALQLTGQGLDNNGGQIRSGGGLALDAGAGAIGNASGALLAAAGASVRGNGLHNQGGTVAANGDLVIAASASDPLAVVNNAGGDIRSAQGSISLSAGELHNAAQGAGTAGQVAAANDLSLTLAGRVDNNDATISAGRDLRLNAGGALTNNTGRLLAGRDAAVTAARIGSREGLIAANGDLVIAADSGDFDNIQGRVQAMGNLTLSAQALDTTAGSVQAGADLTLTTGNGALQGVGAFVGSGGQMVLRTGAADLTDAQLAAGASLRAETSSLQAARLDAQAGGNLMLDARGGALVVQSANIRAAQALSLAGGAVDLRVAQLAANTSVSVRGTDIDATAANVQSPGDISVVATGTLAFANARMTAGQDLEARGSGLGTSAGAQLLAGRDLSVGIGAAFDFAGPGFDYQFGRDLTVRAQGIRTVNQQVSARNLTLDAGSGLLDNTGGTLQASDAMNLRSQGLANHGGLIATNGDLSGQAGTGAVDNAGAAIYSTQGALSLAGGAIDNRGGLLSAATDLTVQGASLNNAATTIAGGRNLTVQLTGALDNTNGKLVANQGSASVGANGIDNTGGIISGVAGAGAHAGTGTLDNRAGIVTGASASASGAFVNNAGGVISGLNSASVSGGNIANDAGVIEAGTGGIAISAQGQLSNTNSGAFRGIVSSGGISINAGSLSNFAGYIGAGGALGINAGSIDNRLGVFTGVGAGNIAAGGAIDNTAGAMTSAGDLSVSAASLSNSGQSVVFAGNNLAVNAGQIDNSGTRDGSYRFGLLAGGNLAVNSATLNNSGGAIVALGDASVRATSGIDNRSGQIAGNSVTVETPDLLNTGGRVDAQQRLIMRVQRFSADGSIASNGSLELETIGDYTNTGTVAANGDLAVRTTGSYTNQGTVSAQRNLLLSAANLHNQAGAAIVSQSTTLQIAGTLNNQGLINSSNGATTIVAGTINNADRIYGNGVNITAAVNNAAGAVIASRSGDVTINGALANTDRAEVLALGNITVNGSVLNRNAMLNATGNIGINGNLQNLNGGLTLGSEIRTQPINSLYIIPSGDTTRYDASTLGWTGHSGGHWVLPSATYPIASFGADPKQAAIQCGQAGGDANWECSNAYAVSDPVWALLGVAAPGQPPAAPPNSGGCQIFTGGENGSYERDTAGACGGYWSSYDAYQVNLAASYSQLDGAIAAFNNDLNARTLIDWYEQEITHREIVKPTVTSSLPGMVFAGGNIYASGGVNQDSAIVAGGAVSGGFSNQASAATQTSTDYGQMRFNHRVYHGGFSDSYSRDLSPWQPVTGGTQTESVFLDTLNAPRAPPSSAANSTAGPAPNAQVPGVGAVAADARSAGGTGAASAGTQGGTVAAGSGQAVQVGSVTATGQGNAGPVQVAGTPGIAGVSAAGPQTQAASGGSVSLSGAADTPLPGSVIAAGVRAGQAQTMVAVQTSFSAQAAARPVPTVPSEALIARVASAPAMKGAGYATATAKGPLNAPASRLFRINDAPGAGYLIETDPEFTDYGRFLGSDWMLAQLELDPERTMKRYGDAFAEQRLVDDQIFALTGRRYLSGYGATQDEYQDLLNAGVMYARDYQLTPGVALTGEQMASLTTDIVWLETKTISLPDGSTTEALVPTVYLRRPVAGDLSPTGSLISGSNIELRNPGGDLTNSGTLYAHGGNNAGGTLTLQAANITNSGTLAGNAINVTASQDIRNVGGQITGLGVNGNAGSTVALNAGRDIVLQTTTQTGSQTIQGPGGTTQVSRTNVDRVATIAAYSITLAALGNIELQGAKVTASGNLALKAGGSIDSFTVEDVYGLNVDLAGPTVQARARHYKVDTNQHTGSALQAGGSLSIGAANYVALTATQIKAGGDLSINAHNVVIDAAVNNSTVDVQATGPNNFSRAVTQNQSLALSTLTAGGNLTIAATNVPGMATTAQGATGDVRLTGVAAKAGGSVSISANDDVVIEDVATQQTTNIERYSRSKGFLTTTTRTGSSTSSVTESTASSIAGNQVTIMAGNDLGIQGSHLNGREGVLLSGERNVIIREAHQVASQSLSESTIKSGLAGNLGFIPIPAKDQNTLSTETLRDTAVASTLRSAQGSVHIQAGSAVALQGVQVEASKDIAVEAGEVSIVGAIGVTSASGTTTDKGTHIGALGWHDPGKGPGAKETINGTTSNSTLARSTLTGQNVSIIANGKNGSSGDIVLAGTTINATGSLALAASNTVLLSAQTTRSVAVEDSQGRDIGWQKFTDKGRIDDTTNYNQFNVGALTVRADKVEVQIARPQSTTADLQTSVRTLAQHPGMAWLQQLQTDPGLQGKLNWKEVEEAHKNWDFKKEGLTQEGAIIVTLVVAWATAGLGAEAGAALGGSLNTAVGAAVLQAGITTLTTQASIALLNNKGDVGKALHDLGSNANVKGLLTALITAGILANINPLLVKPGNPIDGNTFASQLQTNLVGGVTKAVVASAINGTSLEEGLKGAIKGALIDSFAAEGANLIGDKLEGFSSEVAHAIASCVAGAARTGNSGGCSAGALGAAIGHIAAELYGDKPGTVEFAALIGGIAAAAAGASPEQINVASAAGSNAAANNYLTHEQARAKQKLLDAARTEEDRRAVNREYDQLDAAQSKQGAACILQDKCDSVLGKVTLKETLDQLIAVCAPPRLCTTEEKRSIVELQDLYTKREAIKPDTTIEEFLLGNKVVGAVFTVARSAIARAFGETAATISKPLGVVDDFHGNPVNVVEAAAQYGFKTDVNFVHTGANLESSAARFVKDEAGKDFIAVFDSKIGTQGIDLAYAKMAYGKPQLVIGEAKAGDSAMTALGENRLATLNRNMEQIQKSIEAMPNSQQSIKDALLLQLKEKTYQVELYTATGNAAKTSSRVDDILTGRLGQPISRVITFGRQ